MENKEIVLEIISSSQFITLNDILSEYKTYLNKLKNEFVENFELDNINCSFDLFEIKGKFPVLKTQLDEVIESSFVFNNTKQRTFKNLEQETNFKLVFTNNKKAEEIALGFYNHLKNNHNFIFGLEFDVKFNFISDPLSNIIDKSYDAINEIEFRIKNGERFLNMPLTKYNHDQIWEIVNALGISIDYEKEKIYWKGKGNDLKSPNDYTFTYSRILYKGDLSSNLEIFINKFIDSGYVSKGLIVKYDDIMNGNYTKNQGEKKLKEIQDNKMNYKFYYVEGKEEKVLERSVNVNSEINKEIEKELENKKPVNSNNKDLKI